MAYYNKSKHCNNCMRLIITRTNIAMTVYVAHCTRTNAIMEMYEAHYNKNKHCNDGVRDLL